MAPHRAGQQNGKGEGDQENMRKPDHLKSSRLKTNKANASLMTALASTLAALTWSEPAHALLFDQIINSDVPGLQNEPGVTVTSRLRPDYDSGGVHFGNVLVRPDVSEGVGYDDNVTGTASAKGSPFVQTRVTLQAAQDTSLYAVGTQIRIDDIRYLSQPRQSTTNWTASIGGTYKLMDDSVTLNYSHANLNQTPRDLDAPRLEQPIAYRTDTVQAGYRMVLNRLALRPELSVTHTSFDNGVVAGVPYLQSYRDRTVVAPSITVTYELAPQRNLVAVVRDSVARYSSRPAGSMLRDYNDIAVLAGIDYGASGMWRYRLLAGYEVRTFASAAVKPIQAPVAEMTVVFTPTNLTTVTGTLSRRIQDAAAETTVGYTETALQFEVDHEYLRNVLFRAQAGVFLDEFNRNQGSATLYTAGGGVTWLLNRNLRLAATYDFTSRPSGSTTTINPVTGLSSTSAVNVGPAAGGLRTGLGFTENRFLLQVSLGL